MRHAEELIEEIMAVFGSWNLGGSRAVIFFIALSELTTTSTAIAGGIPDCKPIRYEGGFIAREISVKGEGPQCLMQDLVQRSAIDMIDGRQRGAPGSVIRFFRASGVDLDMRGHLVTSEPFENATGITLSSDRPLLDSEVTRAKLARAISEGSGSTFKEGMQIPVELSVRNGVVRTPGARGVGVYLGFYKTYDLSVNFYSRAYAPRPEDDHPMSRQIDVGELTSVVDPWDYKPETRFKVDNLNIKAGGRGVIMTGAKNVLRNSTIEVDSDTAVYLYGPGTVVEGNTFIIHQNPKYPYPAKLPAALKLRDADGAIIRNNRFIIKGGLFGMFKGQAEVAINLLESRDVTIEGNTIDGAKGLVRKDEASTFAERGNTFK